MTAVKTCCCFCHCLQCSGEQLVSMKHFHEALKSVRPSCLRSSMGRTELSPVTWEQIGGLDDVKLKLRQVANWVALLKNAHLCIRRKKPYYWRFVFPHCLHVKEHRVADGAPWSLCSSRSVSTSRCAAVRASGMRKDDACQSCRYFLQLCLPVCQWRWPLLSLRRRFREGFSSGSSFL